MASFSTFVSGHVSGLGGRIAKGVANAAKTGLKDAYNHGGKQVINNAAKEAWHKGKAPLKHGAIAAINQAFDSTDSEQ